MSAESTIYSVLSGASGITALVSDRIYPDILPQKKPLPAVVYTRSGTEYLSTLGSPAVASSATIEIWCFALTRPAAEALADAVLTALIVAKHYPSDRRPEYEEETQTCASVVVCNIWQ